MTRRMLELVGVAAAVLAVALLLQLAPVPVAGQAQDAPEPSEAAPAEPTAWGEPDLQGIWTSDYEIPLQRPHGSRAVNSSPMRSGPSWTGNGRASSASIDGTMSAAASRTSGAPTPPTSS